MKEPHGIRLVRVAVMRAAALVALSAVVAIAQDVSPATGTLVGRIVDAQSGQPLSEAGVQIVGTTRGVQTGLDGRFRFAAVPSGTITIQVRRLGFQPKQITGLYLEAGKTIEQAIVMEPTTVMLDAVVATADKEAGSVSAALNTQRNATAIVSSMGAEQISKSPDSDAAQALQRMSGTTIQDGKFLSIRGLDPRFTTASLNGARLPSPEPERKVVPFDIFPASLLEAVTTSKTFTPDQPGDFSGGAVDMKTREAPFETVRTYAFSFGLNDAVTGRQLLSAPATGAEWLGFGGDSRRLPAVLAGEGNLNGNYSQQQYNQFVSAFRNAWSAREVTGRPSTSVSMTAGGEAVAPSYSYSQ